MIHLDEKLRELLKAATPLPWKLSKQSDAIVSDLPAPTARRSSQDIDADIDADCREYYGGHVVAESMQRADRDLVLYVMNRIHEVVTAGEAES